MRAALRAALIYVGFGFPVIAIHQKDRAIGSVFLVRNTLGSLGHSQLLEGSQVY